MVSTLYGDTKLLEKNMKMVAENACLKENLRKHHGPSLLTGGRDHKMRKHSVTISPSLRAHSL